MKTIDEIRRDNARIIAEHAGGNTGFSERIDRETTQTSRFIGRNFTKNIGDQLARHIEECFNLERGWLDQNRETEAAKIDVENISKKDLVTLYTTEQIQNKQKPTKETICPFEHSSNTYAFTVEGSIDSNNPMHPTYGRAYPVGCIVFVDPELADSVKSGDVVAAMLLDDNIFTFRLYSKTDGVEMLMPLNGRFPPVAPGRPFKILGKVIGAVLP